MSKMRSIKFDPNNANLGTEEGQILIRKSLEDLKPGRSVLCDRNGVLIAGNKTYEQAQYLGIPTREVVTDGSELIVVVREDLDLEIDEQATQLAIADNRASQVGLEWSIPKLKEVEEKTDISWLFPDGIEEGGGGSRGFRRDGIPQDPSESTFKSEVGQIWELGRHRLMIADCISQENLYKLMDGKAPEVIWSDPPYVMKCQKKGGEVGKYGKNYPKISGDGDPSVAIASFKFYWERYPKIPQVWWGANYYSPAFPISSGWIFWDKLKDEGLQFADGELAWTNSKKVIAMFKWLWNGCVKQGEAANKRRYHPNQKPVELVSWYWENYAEGRSLMLDPFLGSGTTILAAQQDENEKKTVYGFELLPDYGNVVLQRWADYYPDIPPKLVN